MLALLLLAQVGATEGVARRLVDVGRLRATDSWPAVGVARGRDGERELLSIYVQKWGPQGHQYLNDLQAKKPLRVTGICGPQP